MTDEEILARLPLPEEVIKAYELNNLRPRAEYADVTDGMTCAIGACNGRNSQYPVREFAETRGVNQLDVRHFGVGFDSGYLGKDTMTLTDVAFLRGKEVGQAVRKHFSKEV